MSRLTVFRLLILVMFVAMTTRLWGLQIQQGAALSREALGHTTQIVWNRPIRGEILASDGTTRLAESLPAYTVAIRPNQLPASGSPRQQVFARLDDLVQTQGTLVLSPTDELRYAEGLRTGLEQLAGPLPANVLATPALTVTVPLGQALRALQLTERFSTTLSYRASTEQTLLLRIGPAYQTVPITTTRSLDLSLAIEENMPYLPGVVVEGDYQRAYPHSAEVQSLSHLLGYIQNIDMCDIMRRNPPSSYGSYSVADQAACGIEPGHLLVDTAPMHYLLNDRIGKDGLERVFEFELRGRLGQEEVEVDVHARLIAPPRVTTPTVNGNNLVLTIDYDLQKKSEAIIRNWIAKSERRRTNPDPKVAFHREYTPIEAGVAIVLEVKTGRVLAMVSWPAFDNNIFNRRRSEDEVKQIFNPARPHPAPAINQSIAAAFPPGSTWKQFTGAAALEGGAITPDSTVRDKGQLFVKNQYYETDPTYDQRFPNSIIVDRGWINIRTALQFSTNNFFQSIMGGTKFVRNLDDKEKIAGLDPTGEAMAAMARAFGFGQATGIDLPYEADGTVPSKSWKAALPEGNPNRTAPWSIGDMYNAAIGQGFVLATPLQLALASAAVANGGTLYKPQLVKEIRSPQGGLVRAVEPEVRRQLPLSASTIRALHEGMRLAVTNGFDNCARSDISGLEVAGKTGTAEYTEPIDLTKPDVGDNSRKRSHAWFVGFAPYDKPEIEVLTLVEGAGDMGDGSATITVPAVVEIMQAYFKTTPPPASFRPVPPYNLPCHNP